MHIIKKSTRCTTLIKTDAGFTMIELLVSFAIISVISAVVFFQGRAFNDSISMTSALQEVSLAVREAQSYGVSVRESSVGSNNFNLGYGIHFDYRNPTFAIIFKDTNANGKYDGGTDCSGSDECLEKVYYGNGVKYFLVVAYKPPTGDVPAINGINYAVDLIFIRPSTDATINLFDSSGNLVPYDTSGPYAGPYVKAQLWLINGHALRPIDITNTGQISIEKGLLL
jgi:prepilin-type N-terminal cleavage/methylation domain-containing protein